MARTMKKTTKVEEPILETVENKTVEKPKVAKKKKEFKGTDGILCRSVTTGGLYMIGKKTGMVYEWGEYGREYEVEYRDLVIAVRTRSEFVFNPYFIIEDEDFIEEFPIVKKFYEESYNVDELDNIIDYPIDMMKNAIAALPPSAMKNFQNMVSTAVRSGRLDSIEKIRTLDEIFGTDLKLLTEMGR